MSSLYKILIVWYPTHARKRTLHLLVKGETTDLVLAGPVVKEREGRICLNYLHILTVDHFTNKNS